MALRCFEGFDCIASGQVGNKLSAQTGTPGSSCNQFNTTTGVYGYGSAYNCWGGSPSTIAILLDNQPTWYVCFHMYASNSSYTVSLGDGGTSQVYLSINSSTLKLELHNGAGTLLATSSAIVGNGLWHYIELSCTINNTAGASVCNIDGVQQWNLSSVNTRNTTNNYANRLTIGNQSAYVYTYFDNLVIMDGTGSTFNGFQGEMRIAGVLPNAAGTYAQFTPDSGANYARVNQNPDDGDTSYVASSTPGNLDSYNFTDLSFTSGTILAVNVTAIARKDDVAARTLSLTARMSGVDYVGANVGTMSSTYLPFCQMWPTNDPGGNGWTISSFNAAEFGIKQVS